MLFLPRLAHASLLLPALVAGLAFVAVPPAAAATGAAASAPAAKAKAAKGKPADKPVAGKSPILTPAQLRDCENLKSSMRTEGDSALAMKKEIDAERAGIDKSAAEIKTQLETIDRTSQEAIDGYNARVTQRDQSIDAYQSKVTVYNARVVELGSLKEKHEKNCESRRYDDRDLADLKRGRK